ncbi:hypothetical protein C0Q70_19374 [Pomacea canaliculata]|uniref:SRCR domain-containing protein n=1 Tax=Pomacea canaliculata TaxID=400727 RepID=A0A2T7NJ62_POMCA|nr:probable serine/threonine-protein kinase kinX [Pomacea canaliculata]PVD21205.1 hypothetical protein C0Q70_19374 [Pomacea canaliculata]
MSFFNDRRPEGWMVGDIKLLSCHLGVSGNQHRTLIIENNNQAAPQPKAPIIKSVCHREEGSLVCERQEPPKPTIIAPPRCVEEPPALNKNNCWTSAGIALLPCSWESQTFAIESCYHLSEMVMESETQENSDTQELYPETPNSPCDCPEEETRTLIIENEKTEQEEEEEEEEACPCKSRDEPKTAEEGEKPETAEEISEAETVEDVSEPETVETIEESHVPEAVEEISELEAIEEISEPEAVEEISEPEAVEEIGEPAAVEEISEPEAVEEIGEPAAVEEISEPEAVEEIGEPAAVEEISEPEAVEEISEPEAVEEISEPKLETVPEYKEPELERPDKSTQTIKKQMVSRGTYTCH